MGAKAAIAGFVLVIVIPLLIVAVIQQAVASIFSGSGDTSQPSASALSDIPADYLALYQAAALSCPGLDWSVLAAIGKVETDHGRSTLPGIHSGHNSAGAEGPMQFLPATFAGYDHPPHPAVPPRPRRTTRQTRSTRRPGCCAPTVPATTPTSTPRCSPTITPTGT